MERKLKEKINRTGQNLGGLLAGFDEIERKFSLDLAHSVSSRIMNMEKSFESGNPEK